MKADFNKLLVERERSGHRMHFGENRHLRILNLKDEDGYPLGGRESMRKRHKISGEYKSFNENLNPLKGWVRGCLGKKWDKCYSELRKTFDARGVINDHILQHLYDYVDVNAKLIDGKVMTTRRYSGAGFVPISQSLSEYYVCPKDGIVKKTNKAPRRSVIKEEEARKQREKDAVFRALDADNHLHLIDGVWYHFTLKDLPEPTIRIEKPAGVELFKVGNYNGSRLRSWDDLNEQEKEKYGIARVGFGAVLDLLTGQLVYKKPPPRSSFFGRSRGFYSSRPGDAGAQRYHATKVTASHKLLKQAGIVNT